MPDNPRTDDVEKLLADEKAVEDRKQALIADILKQKEAPIAAFDDKLAELGYHANFGKTRRSHHRKPAAPDAAAKAVKPKP
ncbi:MAG: hypothetical protein DMG59_22405 [Acidobacteria bacterium]|nr:MAG: hypothetical protein DMG59_22405 [Acidobacteriota bacterium]